MVAGVHKLVVGNVVSKRDKRTVNTQRGETSVLDFTVADTPRTFNKKTDEWEDGITLFSKVTAWGKLADNIDESFNIGDRVFIYGTEKREADFTTKDGEEREGRPYVDAMFAGHEVSRYPAHSEKPVRKKGESGSSYSKNDATVKKSTPAKESEDSIDLDFDDDDLPF